MSKIVLQQQLHGIDVVIRYPQTGDENIMLSYINELSAERTFILMQGDVLTLEDERIFLNSSLEKISQKKGLLLLALSGRSVIGIASIDLGRYTTSHVGNFSISIKKEYRSKGIGKLLMNTIIDEARNNLSELEIITLTVRAENTIAQKMYSSIGFKKYGSLPDGIKLENGYRDHDLMYKRL